MNNIWQKIKLPFIEFKNGDNKLRLLMFIFAFYALTIFSTFSFAGRAKWNYVNMVINVILMAIIILYLLLYSRVRFDMVFVLFALFNILVFISSAISGFKNFNFTILLNSMVSFFVYQILIENPKNIRYITYAFLIGGIAHLFHYFIIYFKPLITLDFSSRLGGYFDNENEISNYLLVIGISFLYFLFYEKKKLAIIGVFVSLWFVFSTGSMSNILMFGLFILAGLYHIFPKSKRWILFSLIGLSIVVLFVIIQIPALDYYKRRIYGIINEFLGIKNEYEDGSASARMRLAKEGFLIFLRNPLFGDGFGATSRYSFDFHVSHNNFFELLSAFGVFAAVTFQCLLFIPLRGFSEKKRNRLADWLILFVIINQLFLVTYNGKIEYHLIAYAWAANISYKYNRKYLDVMVINKKMKFNFVIIEQLREKSL